jgi:transcriptional regulator with XRE-family HTH domain
MAKRKPTGHPTSFSAEQNRLLRAALRDLKRERDLSQVAVGELLGISQQVAGKLLSPARGGLSYGTATKLARALGFEGVDDFFVRGGEAHRGAA